MKKLPQNTSHMLDALAGSVYKTVSASAKRHVSRWSFCLGFKYGFREAAKARKAKEAP